tara:strand:- start:281 stop:508 length:228 start_codon:yes stop_codon:yes gene_type:complete
VVVVEGGGALLVLTVVLAAAVVVETYLTGIPILVALAFTAKGTTGVTLPQGTQEIQTPAAAVVVQVVWVTRQDTN